MSQICINVPSLQIQQTIDVAETVNGQKRVMNYRVESFAWPVDLSAERRIERLRAFIGGYDAGWELVQIGPAAGGLIPVMFRQRGAPSEQA